MNIYNLTLNLDKTQRIINSTVVHRVGDKGGTTIKATIIGGQIYSPVMVLNFENGEEISINGVANGSTITIVLDDRFNDNLGKARCYIKGTNGVSTQTFTILCIEDIHFTDADLTWKNSNFEGKIVGSLKENPNILGRYLTDLKTKTKSAAGSTFKNFYQYINSDIFNSSKLLEVDQNHYDSLKTGFYDSLSGLSHNGNYIASNTGFDVTIKYTDSGLPGGSVSSYSMHPTFARLKVPMNTSKVKINNILNTSNDLLKFEQNPGSTDLRSIPNSTFNSYLTTFSAKNVGNFVWLYDYSTAGSPIPYMALRDVKGIELINDNKKNVSSITVDTTKTNIIDHDGYIDIIQQMTPLGGSPDEKSYLNASVVYPQINIDYGYLDLS